MTTFVAGSVTVSVPATSANLGPGFDALGLALDHRDRVTARVVEAGAARITVRGVGAGVVPLDEGHLVHRAMRATFERLGVSAPPVQLDCDNVIPHARGLGSSSAAIVAGVCAARALVVDGDRLMDDAAALSLSAELEGHPDNVAPALLGGFTVAWTDSGVSNAIVVDVDPRVQAVALVPPDGVETSVARGLLPATVPHREAATNAGRAALLVAALSRAPELLLAATEDRLHQEYRAPAMPDSLALVHALRTDGLAAVVSGAGPTVLVLTDAARASDVVGRAPRGWQALALALDTRGAVVEASGGVRED